MKRYLLYSLPIFITGLFVICCSVDLYFMGLFLLPMFTLLLKPLGQFSIKEVWEEYHIFHENVGFEYLRIFSALFFIGFNVWAAFYVYTHWMPWWNFIFFIYGLIIINSNFGIALAHDLMHSTFRFSRLLGTIILLINGFFYLETDHLFIHHRYVATDKDPASAKRNDNVYSYLFYSIKSRFLILFVGQWPIRRPLHFLKNFRRMLVCIFMLITASFISITNFWLLFFQFLFVTLLYEVITYIQHFGLRRQKVNDHFELVSLEHSWNCFYKMSAYMYYMMPIHSLHHLKKLPKQEGLNYAGPSFPRHFSQMALLAFFPKKFIPMMSAQISLLKLPTQ